MIMPLSAGLLLAVLPRGPSPAVAATQTVPAVAALQGQCQDVVRDVNYAGNDLARASPAASADVCCDLCEADTKCKYFTFCAQCTSCPGSGTGIGCCHLKSSKAGAEHSTGRVSGRSGTKPGPPAPPFPPLPPPPPSPPPHPAPRDAKNVLFVMADDLRPQLSAAYGHSWMKTPSLDKFTSTATVFLRAFAQQQVCSPSRNSFMT
jgi:hypothetical protein